MVFGTQRQTIAQLRLRQPVRLLRRCSSSRKKGCWHLPRVLPGKRKEPTSEDEEGSAESVRSSLTMALRVYLQDEGEEEEQEEQVEDAPIEVEEEDLEKLRKMKAQSERPAMSESDKPALEKKENKRFPLETTSKAMAKPKPKQKTSGFTHGGYSIMAQQLIQQKTEQLEHMKETYNYLIETHPTKVSLGETIKGVEAAIENIQKEQAKTRPRAKAYSSRQEADKKVASGRVAYIKERQRKRAVEHRLKTRRERAIANVARQEEAERRFNRPEKDKVFPSAEVSWPEKGKPHQCTGVRGQSSRTRMRRCQRSSRGRWTYHHLRRSGWRGREKRRRRRRRG